MSDTITAPDTIWIAGQWRAAHWLAEVVDPSTGELLVTATLASPPHDIVVLRITRDLVRDLRRLAGFPAQAEPVEAPPAEFAPAVSANGARSAQFAPESRS